MRRLVSLLVIFVLCLGMCGTMLTAQDKAQQPKRTPEEQFKRMDANNDGKLTVQEFVGKREGEKAEKAKDQFKRLDKNNDGAVTLEEFLAGQKKK